MKAKKENYQKHGVSSPLERRAGEVGGSALRLRSICGALICLLSLGTPSAEAEEVYHWDFTKSVVDQVNGVRASLVNPAGRTRSGYTFAGNDGISIFQPRKLAVRGNYTIILSFSLSENDTGYQKLIDFANFSLDNGMYAYDNYFYFYDFSPDIDNFTFTPGQRIVLVLRRDARNKRFNATYNGHLLWSFVDSESRAVFSGPSSVMKFFDDDGTEEPAGTVRKIRVFDTVLPSVASLDRKSKTLKKQLKAAQRSGNELRIERAKEAFDECAALLRALRKP